MLLQQSSCGSRPESLGKDETFTPKRGSTSWKTLLASQAWAWEGQGAVEPRQRSIHYAKSASPRYVDTDKKPPRLAKTSWATTPMLSICWPYSEKCPAGEGLSTSPRFPEACGPSFRGVHSFSRKRLLAKLCCNTFRTICRWPAENRWIVNSSWGRYLQRRWMNEWMNEWMNTFILVSNWNSSK